MTAVASIEFSRVARAVASVARSAGWQVPSFRSPPGLEGARRTIRRRPGGDAVVAVRIFDRPWPAVVGDLIEGVVVINRLREREAQRCRDTLWAAVTPREDAAA